MTTSVVGGGIGVTPPAVTIAEAPRPGSRRAARGTTSFRGRWVAIPAAIGAVAHIWVLIAHPHGVVLGALMIAMAMWCGMCAIEAWRKPNDRGFRMLIGMSIAMAIIHVALVLGDHGGSGGHAHHGASDSALLGAEAAGTDALVGTSMIAAMLGIAALELVIAFCAAVAIRMRAGKVEARRVDSAE